MPRRGRRAARGARELAEWAATVIAATPPGARLFGPYVRRFCCACDAATCP
ncbi:MAG TPA: hypothetical protein VKB80_10310 [Kofleriaceae bacterium]|nr:hypothetical protein [Kofleriaceae bacterium]